MRSKNSFFSLFLIGAFLLAISSFTACSSRKKSYKVHSGSGMGNKRHKNKHVWGK